MTKLTNFFREIFGAICLSSCSKLSKNSSVNFSDAALFTELALEFVNLLFGRINTCAKQIQIYLSTQQKINFLQTKPLNYFDYVAGWSVESF